MQNIKLLNFIDLKLEEKEMILKWRNHPDIRKWMYNQDEIKLEEHLNFIDSLKLRKDKLYFLVKKEDDFIDEPNPVIIAGFGHFGSTVGRLLKANNVKSTILDYDSDRIDLLRKVGFKVYYGDATRLELLKAAGCENAKLFIAAIDNPTVNLQVIETLKKHFPNLKILTRARNRNDAYELIDHKIKNIYRETLYSAVNMGVDALVELGHRKYSATRQGRQFIKYDEITTRILAEKRHDKMAYLITIKEEIELQEQLLKSDFYSQIAATNHSWDSQHLKNNLSKSSD